MKIIMLKNFWRSGKIELEQGKEYDAPADITLNFALSLVNAGKATEVKPKRKKVT